MHHEAAYDSFPELSSQRLCLRQFTTDDILHVFEALSHPEVSRYTGRMHLTPEDSRAQLERYHAAWHQQTGLWWAITHRGKTGEAIGGCGFHNWERPHRHAEIGYWLLPQYQRRGIMSEALPMIIRYGIQVMNLHRITAVVESENMGSIWLLEKLQFQQEGHLKHAEFRNERFIDLLQYAYIAP